MAQPYVGEIRMFAGNFAPAGWQMCDGATLPISENEVLFQLIGTTYGGDGESTFNVPNMCSRIPVHQGTGSFGTTYQIGEMAGVEQVTLTVQQIPAHTHPMLGSANSATGPAPQGQVYAAADIYSNVGSPPVNMNPAAITPTGGSQPHDNLQPFLVVNYIISLFGIFPSQT
jgi:microcystin-dependent protein